MESSWQPSVHLLKEQNQIIHITADDEKPLLKMTFFDSVTYCEEFVTNLDREVYTNAKVLKLSVKNLFMQTMAFKMNAIVQDKRKSPPKKKTPNRLLGRFALILFTREKADKVCRLVNFEMDKSAVEWKRCNDPKDDPIIQNPEKKQSLFINAF